MKAKKKTKNTATWSELREMVMAYETHGYRIRLLEQKVEDLERLVYKNAEVIDLDKAEELEGVDDSEEVGELTHDEIESIIDMIRYTNNNRLGMVDMGYWNTIISKLFDILDNRINEKRNKK